ncbi:hypothetical protein Taro_049953 [Colocasia esculenta]|uniref:[RNA-polymerase]-subunit kinase n=1 Tax=Colocasia esculenta TaxID=4460 RepID=A0A843XCN8_COLES|nr:hypothetical protein [Colocasia esculenta]
MRLLPRTATAAAAPAGSPLLLDGPSKWSVLIPGGDSPAKPEGERRGRTPRGLRGRTVPRSPPQAKPSARRRLRCLRWIPGASRSRRRLPHPSRAGCSRQAATRLLPRTATAAAAPVGSPLLLDGPSKWPVLIPGTAAVAAGRLLPPRSAEMEGTPFCFLQRREVGRWDPGFAGSPAPVASRARLLLLLWFVFSGASFLNPPFYCWFWLLNGRRRDQERARHGRLTTTIRGRPLLFLIRIAFENKQIGQGTYSNVYRARDLDNGKIVALKKVRFDNLEPESVRFMAREIHILRRLDHPNIVKLEGLVTSRMSCSLDLVFEYMEHDLAGMASFPGLKFTEPQITGRKSTLPHATIFKPQQPYGRCVMEAFKDFPVSALALMDVLLSIDPAYRGTAASALKSEYR